MPTPTPTPTPSPPRLLPPPPPPQRSQRSDPRSSSLQSSGSKNKLAPSRRILKWMIDHMIEFAIGLVTLVVGGYALVVSFQSRDIAEKQLELDQWSSFASWRETCEESLKTRAVEYSEACEEALKIPLPPPPNVDFASLTHLRQFVRRSLSAAFDVMSLPGADPALGASWDDRWFWLGVRSSALLTLLGTCIWIAVQEMAHKGNRRLEAGQKLANLPEEQIGIPAYAVGTRPPQPQRRAPMRDRLDTLLTGKHHVTPKKRRYKPD